MAALAFPQIAQTRYNVRLGSSVTDTDTGHALLLDAARLHTGSQTAVLYEIQPGTSQLKAFATSPGSPASAEDVGVRLNPATSEWFESLSGPVQGRALTESGLAEFPEVHQYQLKRLLVVPLRTANGIFGLLTLGRVADARFDRAALEVAQRAGQLLTAVEAYLQLRNNNSRRRMPTSRLAKKIIKTYLEVGAR